MRLTKFVGRSMLIFLCGVFGLTALWFAVTQIGPTIAPGGSKEWYERVEDGGMCQKATERWKTLFGVNAPWTIPQKTVAKNGRLFADLWSPLQRRVAIGDVQFGTLAIAIQYADAYVTVYSRRPDSNSPACFDFEPIAVTAEVFGYEAEYKQFGKVPPAFAKFVNPPKFDPDPVWDFTTTTAKRP
jgi:hypothetical protein